jgi:SAM-dependent methyltransferase
MIRPAPVTDLGADVSADGWVFRSGRYRLAGRIQIALDPIQQTTLGELLAALDEGLVTLEQVDCPACGSEEHSMVAAADRYGIPVSTAICRSCGLVYRRKRLAKESAETFYSKFYDGLFKGKMSIREYWSNQRIHGRFIEELLAPMIDPSRGPVVEFGAGPGGIASWFSECGFDVRAFDINPGYQGAPSGSRVQVASGGIDASLVVHLEPQVLILSHVLEHTYAPLEVLQECARALPEGGLLFIEVPGLDAFIGGHHTLCGGSVQHPFRRDLLREIVIAHNFEFDRQTLSEMMVLSGFEVIASSDLIRIVGRKTVAPTGSRAPVRSDSRGKRFDQNRALLLRLERARKLRAWRFMAWDLVRTVRRLGFRSRSA